MRPSKTQYYLSIAKVVSERSTCLRAKWGAIIVKDDRIISTGYNGAPRGCKNCCDIGKCVRQELRIPSGQRYELCRSVHAEQNAIIFAAYPDMVGSTMYISGNQNGECCKMCKKMIINAGIVKVVIQNGNDFNIYMVEEWVKEI